MKTVLTDLGIQKVLEASATGPIIKITGVKIGNSIVNPLSTMTDVVNQVWSGGPSFISYHIVDENTFLFRVTLDESIGDFNIGNIGLFLEDGTMFSLTTLVGIESKQASSISSAGNRRIYEILITISNLTNLIDISVLNSSSANLPTLQNETLLPSSQSAIYDCYLIQYHTELKTSCLAILNGTGWNFIPSASSQRLNNFELSQFNPAATPTKAVYWNASTGTFELADNVNGYLGLRNSNNSISNNGIFHDEQLNLTPGSNYYVDTNNPGNLSTTQNQYYVGQAIDNHTLYLGAKPESYLLKTNSINTENPSNIKYPTEAAVVSLSRSSVPFSTVAGSPINWYTAGSVGSATTVARADHTHTIDSGIYFGTCNTAGNTAAKIVSIDTSIAAPFTLRSGIKVSIRWTNQNTIDDITLNVNWTGAYPVYVGNSRAKSGCFYAGDLVDLMFNGSSWIAINWNWVRRIVTPTTYCFIDSSGFKMQGGTLFVNHYTAVTFPVAFISVPVSVSTSPLTCSTGSDTNYITFPSKSSVTTTGFTMAYVDSDAVEGRSGNCSWQAFGY